MIRVTSAWISAGMLLVMFLTVPLGAATYYVDKNNPAASDSNPGTEALPWKTIQKANTTVAAGDTVYIKAGTYNERIMPWADGTASQPIRYLRYGNDDVLISGNVEPAMWIEKDYIVVDGIRTDNVNKHCWIQYCSHVTIQNCHFGTVTSSGGSRSGVYLYDAEHCKILGNTVENAGSVGGDSICLELSNYNVIEGNSVTQGGHACFANRASSYNVWRGNYFVNPDQKIGEVYDLPGAGLENMTERNVWEDNIFDYTPPHWDASPYSGIQYAGQNSIIRRNIFYDEYGPGFRLGLWTGGLDPAEAARNYGNRIYNNVFHNCGQGGVLISGVTSFEINFSDNIFKNNILWMNTYINQFSGEPWLDELDGKGVQIKAGRLNGYYFECNNIAYNTPNYDYLIAPGVYSPLMTPPNHELSWWEAHYPSLYQGNMEVDPQFVDPANHDYHLSPSSPMIDAGTYLTQGFDSGDATLYVLDPSYFYDGYGIEGEQGDWIRLEGTDQVAQIIHVDYATNTLTLDRDVTCEPFQGIALAYEGDAPDLGAYEYTAPAASVVGRYVFYNNSAYDGNDPAANASDDAAIATDKQALLPGGTATFANYTSYSRGINGIMIDITGLPDTPTASDFEFKVGNDNDPSSWATAPAPLSVTVRAAAGAGGSDRITIIWADGAIQKQWLQVTVLATANTGLGSPDVFYFGNAVGETGNSTGEAEVTPTDEVAVRNNPHTLDRNPADITDNCDFNRDRKVGPTDAIICRNNGTSGPTALQLINVP